MSVKWVPVGIPHWFREARGWGKSVPGGADGSRLMVPSQRVETCAGLVLTRAVGIRSTERF